VVSRIILERWFLPTPSPGSLLSPPSVAMATELLTGRAKRRQTVKRGLRYASVPLALSVHPHSRCTSTH